MMDYATSTLDQSPVGGVNRSTTKHFAAETARPSDLGSLRAELDRAVERARSLGHRAHASADVVMGCCAPIGIGEHASDRDRPTAPFIELVSQLHDALDHIDRAIGRL